MFTRLYQEIFPKLHQIVVSQKFYYATLVIFAAQAVYFSFFVAIGDRYVDDSGQVVYDFGVTPDGVRHFGNVQYYADRPLLASPFIDKSEVEAEDLWLGEVTRFPSYLYYYLASFPARAAAALGASEAGVILLLRLLNTVVGLVGLAVFRKIAIEVVGRGWVANAAVFGITITGMYAYLSGAVSYDIPSLVLFFLFLLAVIRAFTQHDGRQYAWAILWGLLVGITKYTYIPFVGLFGLLSLGFYYTSIDELKQSPGRVIAWIKQVFSERKWLYIGLIAAILISGGLMVERIGVNLWQYRSFNPLCDKIFSTENCYNFEIFERNTERALEYQREIAAGAEPFSYNPISYTMLWLKEYIFSLYFYSAHLPGGDVVRLYYLARIPITAVLGLMLVILAWRRTWPKLTKPVIYIGAVSAIYLVSMYIFNLRTMYNLAVPYAHQGRYLLPVIGFIYIGILLIIQHFYRSQLGWVGRAVMWSLIVAGLLAIITHFPIVTFWLRVNGPEWFMNSPAAQLFGV